MSEGPDNERLSASVMAFWRAANYVSVCLLYLKRNVHMQQPLRLPDFKPRGVGHWGCVPSLNFIWACLSSAVCATGSDVRLFVGTGHGGAAWLSSAFVEGSLRAQHGISRDEVGLTRLAGRFGQTRGFPTELGAQYPGLLWPSGEIGYALAVAQGHSISSDTAISVAVVGDGELESAATCAALYATRALSCGRLVVLVNANGLRMGGASGAAQHWTEDELQAMFRAQGYDPCLVRGFDADLLVVPVKQTVTYRASFGHVELFQEYRKPLRSK